MAPKRGTRSSLNPTGTVAAHELLHIGHAAPVEVANDAVLEAGDGNRKLQSLLLVIAGIQPVDEAAGKAVAAAHTVYHVAYSGKPWFLNPALLGGICNRRPFFSTNAQNLTSSSAFVEWILTCW